MKHALIFSFLLLTGVSFYSCSKSGDDDNNSGNKPAALLTASAWKYSDAGLDMNSDGIKEANLPPGFTLSACETDNTITFRSDNSGVIDEGPTKCNTTNPQTVPFTYTLKNEGKEITFSTALFPGINGDIKIVELTASKLTLSKLVSTTVNGFPVSANVIIFLTH